MAYLETLDLSNFDPKAAPPKTDAFWHIVNAARAPEEAELASVLESLGYPKAVTIDMLVQGARLTQETFAEWLRDQRNRRQIPHRLEDAGCEPVRNTASKDGLWKIHGRRQVVYARRELTLRDRSIAVAAMTGSR